jgi:hypothetical protein
MPPERVVSISQAPEFFVAALKTLPLSPIGGEISFESTLVKSRTRVGGDKRNLHISPEELRKQYFDQCEKNQILPHSYLPLVYNAKDKTFVTEGIKTSQSANLDNNLSIIGKILEGRKPDIIRVELGRSEEPAAPESYEIFRHRVLNHLLGHYYNPYEGCLRFKTKLDESRNLYAGLRFNTNYQDGRISLLAEDLPEGQEEQLQVWFKYLTAIPEQLTNQPRIA